MANLPRVTVWNEFRHERTHEKIQQIYPRGIHVVIGEHLAAQGFPVHYATLDEPEHGLTQEVLESTDVLIWWGHMAHGAVSDEIVDRVQRRVLDGMGFVPLHSAHYSKPFRRLMGTDCTLRWREIGERERVWVIARSHPIAEGLGDYIEIPHTEMYGEPFDVPAPDTLVFVSWYQGGEVFRSGCCYLRGLGKIFYFSPGHESLPIYYQPEVQRVISNAVKWAAPIGLATGETPPRNTGNGNRKVPLEPVAVSE